MKPTPRRTPRPISPLQATASPPAPARPSGSGKGKWIAMLILIAIAGGGLYYYDYNRKEEARLAAEAKARAEEQARLKAEEEARRKAEEEARRKAEEERLRKLREEEEARRRAEEEARRRQQEQQEEEPEPEPEPDEPEPEPTPTPTEPVKTEGPYDAELALTGAGVTAKETRDLYQSMIDRLLTEGDFAEFNRAFTAKIQAAVPEIIANDKLNYNAYKRSQPLMQAVDICSLVRLTGADYLHNIIKPSAKQSAADGFEPGVDNGKEFMAWLLKDKSEPLHAFMRGFTANQGHKRNMSYHLSTLRKLWASTPEKLRDDYLNLAIACSLISPNVANSPSQVKTKEPTLTIEQVYTYFREMDAKKKLLTNIKKMDVTDLLFVVDVRLPKSEFEWVQKNMKYSQAQWGEAYASIRYRMEIAAGSLSEGELYQKYNFAEIREDGGVCRHQGYFAANTAKCKGVPAVYIVGDGDRGPHAWIASMVDAVNWKQTGSYGYNSGRFSNPCSGRNMHESVLLNQSKKTSDDKLAAAYDVMQLAEHLVSIGCGAEARSAARYVTGAFPLLTAAWTSRISVLTADKDNIPEADYWRKLSNELTRHGRKNAELLDLAAEIDNNYALAGKTDSAKKSSMKRSLTKLKRTVGNERSDLLLEAVDRQAAMLAEDKDIRGITQLYNKTLKENTERGDVFGNLLYQYIRHMEAAEATKRDWTAMAKATEKLFEKKVLTNTGDHFKLSKEVQIQKIIGSIYKKAGNDKKGDKLIESAEERLQESKQRNG